MQKISRCLDDPLEAAKAQERADALIVRLNEIEIEKLHAEIEYVCVGVEG